MPLELLFITKTFLFSHRLVHIIFNFRKRYIILSHARGILIAHFLVYNSIKNDNKDIANWHRQIKKHEKKNRKNSVKPSDTLKITHAIREWHEVNLNMTETRNIAETICKFIHKLWCVENCRFASLTRESTQRELLIDLNRKRDFQLIPAAMTRNGNKTKNFERESMM